MEKQAGKMGAMVSSKEKRFKTEVSLAKTCCVFCILFLLSWVPYATIAILALCNYRGAVTPFSAMLPVMFAKASACYNPLVYTLSHPRFKLELRKRFPCLCACLRPNKSFTSSSPDSESQQPAGNPHGHMGDSQSSLSEISVNKTPMPQPSNKKITVKNNRSLELTAASMKKEIVERKNIFTVDMEQENQSKRLKNAAKDNAAFVDDENKHDESKQDKGNIKQERKTIPDDAENDNANDTADEDEPNENKQDKPKNDDEHELKTISEAIDGVKNREAIKKKSTPRQPITQL
ncbi:unnamed protein product [Owenia fusiformis]|uniref:G-protein coupled receptors family 1 profile domain-containing protein n=1 Tax=Owenia fusiformis TaxID=6347 RepID=A0A8S4PX54_OWEFU|nr:unnamed protein product [Owenia fusiformis]